MFLVIAIFGFVTLPSSAVSKQYHFVSEVKIWSEAQSHCRTHYTDLATLHSTDDVNTLTQLGTQTGSAWIGLYDDLNSWTWSIANDSFYGPDETLYRNWASGEPNNYGGNEMCVHMYGQGTWNDITCSNTNPFVCYGQNDSHILITDGRTWFDAQAYCRTNYIDLASIRNAAENNKVQAAANGTTVYIGLYRNRTWSDGSDSSFRHWKSGQPDNSGGLQNCTAMSFSDSGRWTDEDCVSSLPFFCYTDNPVVVGLRMVVTSESELTEDEIDDMILKPLQEELIQKGLPNSTTLRLRRVHLTNT